MEAAAAKALSARLVEQNEKHSLEARPRQNQNVFLAGNPGQFVLKFRLAGRQTASLNLQKAS